MRKIIRNFGVFLIAILLHTQAQSQDNRIGFSLSNNTAGMPVVSYHKLFYSQFHPGIEGQMSWQLNKKELNRIYVHANVGVYYHQFIQTLVRLYPTIAYERGIGRWSANIGLGAGYGLSFEGNNAFVQQADGSYKPKFLGARSQYIIAAEIGGRFALIGDSSTEGPQLTFKFCSYMQGTYVKSYIPFLPMNSFQVGISFPMRSKISE